MPYWRRGWLPSLGRAACGSPVGRCNESRRRVFARRSDLLVFDDVSSALDAETEALLWQRLAERHDSTCLMASHSHIALARADQIIVLDEGHVIARGTLEQLLAQSPELGHLWLHTWQTENGPC